MTVSSSRNPEVSAGRSIPDTVAGLRATFRSGRTKPLEWRRAQLTALLRLVEEREQDFAGALATDLGRPAFEAWLGDLAPVSAEVRHALKKLPRWVKPKRVPVPVSVQPGKAWYQYE